MVEIAGELEVERCRGLESQGDISGQTPDPSQRWTDGVTGLRTSGCLGGDGIIPFTISLLLL